VIFTDKALDLLKQLEGLRLQAYQDDAGIWTVGYGHTGKDVVPGTLWTQAYADEALQRDLQRFVSGVQALVSSSPLAALNDNQFSALVIFAYNVGLQALAGSTLLRHINGGMVSYAPNDFMQWCHIHKDGVLVVDPGLQKRRQAEVALFIS
jgi:lysozyme